MFRRSSNPNLIVGIFLLIVLSLFLSPNFLPRFVSDIAPEIYSGIPCQWLRRADDRANHQSLLGRAVTNPFELSVSLGPFPQQGSDIWEIRITLRNNSLGTVPIVYDPAQVSIGDNGTSGMGLIFTPANALQGQFARGTDPQAFPETQIRLLGPRQSCIHVVEVPAGNVLVDPSLTSGSAQVKAYYRGVTRGSIVQSQGIVATPIYNDQGLWVGYAESDSVEISTTPLQQ
ncbi:MAG: hypothetical protein KJ065_22890 [Anaerolineae bacterium]|nr:hypothetical protein [Anaerolineae bacterium]